VSRASRWALMLLFAIAVQLYAPIATRARADDDLGADDSTGDAQQGSSEPSAQPEPAPATQRAEPGPATDDPAASTATRPDAGGEASAAPGPAAGGRALSLYAGAGAGVGTLMFQRPTPQGVQRLPQTPFGAAELVLRGRAWPTHRLSFEALVAYQTSLGLVLQTSPLFALPQNVDVRWQRVELSVAPVIRLGEAANAPALAFPVGMLFDSLFPGVHQFSVPKYTFGGPQLRAELLLEISNVIRLRAGPQAQWLLLVANSLKQEGACCQGIGFGGRGTIEARVGEAIRVALAYSESHAFVPAGAWRFTSVDHFLTVRVAGEL
jgi:hypothetical protein